VLRYSITVRLRMFVQLFNRGLVTRAVGDDEDVESRHKQKELDMETGRAAAAAAAVAETEIQRAASLPGVTLVIFLYSVVTHLENLQKLRGGILKMVREKSWKIIMLLSAV